MKLAQKEAQGIAEKRSGRRGPGSVIGSSSSACVCALLSIKGIGGAAFSRLWELGFVACFCTKLSDTVSSEIGKAYGKTTSVLLPYSSVNYLLRPSQSLSTYYPSIPPKRKYNLLNIKEKKQYFYAESSVRFFNLFLVLWFTISLVRLSIVLILSQLLEIETDWLVFRVKFSKVLARGSYHTQFVHSLFVSLPSYGRMSIETDC